ncbi:E3 ubiquitin-protein ligase ATL23 [Vitis vinifera]|uniref:E3 ubiquitin-protein ligase ATL23 n=1 Tax=Vitis vinifera TaxID=29760 RepID=A0A438K461_VITVI|nr:E3 ubiquitin-protein ligase ATL23 [Vitis vinifera]
MKISGYSCQLVSSLAGCYEAPEGTFWSSGDNFYAKHTSPDLPKSPFILSPSSLRFYPPSMPVSVMLVFVLPCTVATPEQGLSEAELEKLPKLTGKDLVMEPECAICLEQIKSDQPARLLPGCNHGFHVHCADTWLSRNSVCPVCRIRINPDPL